MATLLELLDKIDTQIFKLTDMGLKPGSLLLGKEPFHAAIFEMRKLRSLDLNDHPVLPDELQTFNGLPIVLDENSDTRITVTPAASFRTELFLRKKNGKD